MPYRQRVVWLLLFCILEVGAQDRMSPTIPGPWVNRLAGQLIYFFEEGDTSPRGNWKTYLAITNNSLDTFVAVHYQIYFQQSGVGLTEWLDYVDILTPCQTFQIDPAEIRLTSLAYSPNALRGSATNGRFVMTATPIDPQNEPSDMRAIAFNYLSGQINTTHLGIGSTFTMNAIGRMAVDAFGSPVAHTSTAYDYGRDQMPANVLYATGNLIDGTTRLFQKIRPDTLILASFLPTSAASGKVTQGMPFGNRLSFLAFKDNYNLYRLEEDAATVTPNAYNGRIPSSLLTGAPLRVSGLTEFTVAPPTPVTGNFPNLFGTADTRSLELSGGWLLNQVVPGSSDVNLVAWFSQNGPSGNGGDYLIGVGTRIETSGALYAVDPFLGNMRRVPAGMFTQGTPQAEVGRASPEGPQFQHTLTRDLAVMETEVTRQMWTNLKAVQPNLPTDPTNTAAGAGADCPVQNLTWYQAVLFANLLSRQMGLNAAYYKDSQWSQPVDIGNYAAEPIYFNYNADGYRLPSEGEWEYFARAGKTGPFSVEEPAYGAGTYQSCTPAVLTALEKVAWFCANSTSASSAVGAKSANPWGLKDIHGNVGEWCWDWSGAYPAVAQTNYLGPAAGTSRVFRDSGWNSQPVDIRSGSRGSAGPSSTGSTRGFRLVRSIAVSTPGQSAVPKSKDVWPRQGLDNVTNEVTLTGSGFVDGANASLRNAAVSGSSKGPVRWSSKANPAYALPQSAQLSVTLQTTFVSPRELRVVVPNGLIPGKYEIDVTNPDNSQTSAAASYTVLDSQSPTLNDLYGNSFGLWTSPMNPATGTAVSLGLIVHRTGGTSTLSNIEVSFRLSSCASGDLLGTGLVSVLGPNGTASTTGITWTPNATGNTTICAVIDPRGVISESSKDNNQISSSFNVLPVMPDRVAPHVDSFAVQKGALSTAILDVILDTSASDPAPSSGIAALYFQEFEFHPGARYWIPIHQSEKWEPYSASSADYSWTLVPFVGLHHLQVWALDYAGNISLFPYKAAINYIPASDLIERQQVRIYRPQKLKAGQTLTAILTPVWGDPDLYIWPPGSTASISNTRPPWVSNLASGTDEISIAVPIEGAYQVEVHGNTRAQYRLIIHVGNEAPGSTGNSGEGKVKAGAPLVSPDNEPDNQVNVPTVERWALRLPLILR